MEGLARVLSGDGERVGVPRGRRRRAVTAPGRSAGAVVSVWTQGREVRPGRTGIPGHHPGRGAARQDGHPQSTYKTRCPGWDIIRRMQDLNAPVRSDAKTAVLLRENVRARQHLDVTASRSVDSARCFPGPRTNRTRVPRTSRIRRRSGSPSGCRQGEPLRRLMHTRSGVVSRDPVSLRPARSRRCRYVRAPERRAQNADGRHFVPRGTSSDGAGDLRPPTRMFQS